MREYKIDTRTLSDIHRQIEELARSYTPEWIFDTQNPDIGSVIGLIFANQMYDNIRRLNTVISKYQVEFVNMLQLGLLPSHPAKGVVAMELITDTITGVDVPKGTKLLADSRKEDENRLVFETISDVHITHSKLRNIVAISGRFGSVIPLLGEWPKKSLFPIPGESLGTEMGVGDEFLPIRPFDFETEGIAQFGVAIYHRSMFDTDQNASISIWFQKDGDNDSSFAKQFLDTGKYQWSYYGENGLTPFESVTEENGVIQLIKDSPCAKLTQEGEILSAIYLETKGRIVEEMVLKDIRISSQSNHTPPAYVLHNEEDLPVDCFMPFGETVSIFDECYIGGDPVFIQAGAIVTMKFSLSFQEKLWSFTPEQEDRELKIIKRKPRPTAVQTAQAWAERVVFEYYNGTGWKRLPLLQDCSTIFGGQVQGEVLVSFQCPKDWAASITGGYQQRTVRMRVTQADNCFIQPCMHHMPVISGLCFSYSYQGEWKRPHMVRTICGAHIEDVTQRLLQGNPFLLFSPLPLYDNALYLGFDKRMEGAPISILFKVLEGQKSQNAPICFEYATPVGFKRLKLIDHTENLAQSGTIVFVPPTDFSPYSVEGVTRYWIRLVDAFLYYNHKGRQSPTIWGIVPNVAEISNVETLEEEEFYIDAVRPNMSFPIAASNILEAEVFVNEIKHFSPVEQRKFLETNPEDVRINYNILGEVKEYFVRWQEVSSFDDSKPGDRHYILDRMDNTIHFGDGISVRIPQAGPDASFTVKAKRCDGEKANVPAGAVNSAFGRLLYIDNIHNPIAAYGGSDMESVDSALKRGANIVNSKNRMVSNRDIVREILSSSTAILKAKCVSGTHVKEGMKDSTIAVVVMMKDFADGPYSFQSMKEGLKKRLLERSEMILLPEDIVICEPVYVEISVDVWMEPANMEGVFEVQNRIREIIVSFIDPTLKANEKVWGIGLLPTVSQIELLLKNRNDNFTLHYVAVTAKYTDDTGVHEMELDCLPHNPMMIGVNGHHAVHTLFLP